MQVQNWGQDSCCFFLENSLNIAPRLYNRRQQPIGGSPLFHNGTLLNNPCTRVHERSWYSYRRTFAEGTSHHQIDLLNHEFGFSDGLIDLFPRWAEQIHDGV